MVSYISQSTDGETSYDSKGRLGALRASQAFRGPIDPPDGHDENEHLALIYQTQEEQFAATVPFVSQGLERGDRCLYIVDENTKIDVLQAMQAANVDVEAALESGALTIHTAQDIYFQDGTFDPDSMLSSLEGVIDEALTEYEGFRATGEMTWMLEAQTQVEDVFEYEARVNELYSGEECIGLCQYNRDRFPAAIIDQAIKTHPHLIIDQTVSENIYYTPPEEFIDPDRVEYGVDQKITSLQSRTAAQTALEEQKQLLRNLYDVSSDRDRPFEEKIEAMLELGCEYFGLDIGALTHLPSHDDDYEIAAIVGPVPSEFAGAPPVQPEPDCFCHYTMEQSDPVGTTDVREVGWDHDLLHEKYGLTAYFGVKVSVGTTPYGTLWFGDTEPREQPFADAEYTILELMAQWVSYELERHEHERDLRRQLEIAASPTQSFEEKLQALFDLGCDRFDLELGAMARVDPEADRFEIEHTSDEHDHLEPGTELPLSETFCTTAIDSTGPASVSSPSKERYPDITVYRQFGLKTYLGTYVPIDGGVDRTFFFVSPELREESFPEEAHTFLQLMGQWVKYELERKQRKQQLQDRQATLEARNDALKRLNQINALVQELIQVLVEEPTRDAIEQTVCDRLVASDFYQAAWIGDQPLLDGQLPRSHAGLTEDPFEEILDASAGSVLSRDLGELALETQQVQVTRHATDEARLGADVDHHLVRRLESTLAVPIRYEETCYGVLMVYADQSDAFDERQQSIFEAFGETLGFAIAATDRKQALVTDEAVALELRVRDPDNFFVSATVETDATFRLDGVVVRDDGSHLVYLTVTGVSPELILDLAEQDATIEHARLIDEHDEEASLEFRCNAPTVAGTFAEYGASVTSATVTDGEGSITVELSQTADVRSVVEAAQATFSDVEIVAKRTVDRPVQTTQRLQTTFTDRLTDKQREALRTAYLAGYFEQPRASSGEEIAATLGISTSTFHQHLQVGLGKLLSTVVDEPTQNDAC